MKSKATTVRQYLDALPDDRRADVEKIHRTIAAAAPSLKPHIMSGMIAYGTVHYRYPSGREGDWSVIALASQKNYISVYICAVKDGRYIAEANAARLGKVSCGRSCIRFKKLADVDLKVLASLCKEAQKVVHSDKGAFQI